MRWLSVARTKKEAFLSKSETALIGAGTGSAIGSIVGGPVGGTVGAILGGAGGLIFGDTPIVFNEPMICIPAREQYKLSSEPSYMVYAHAGETLMPTGGNVDDMSLGAAEAEALTSTKSVKRKLSPYNRFTKRFKFRAKKKSESQAVYFGARSKAVSRAWKKEKRGGK